MILQGNAMHIPLADASVDCCVTSPPYWGLRDYGISDQLGLERTPDCGRPFMAIRKDLTPKQYQFVMSRLKELGLI